MECYVYCPFTQHYRYIRLTCEKLHHNMCKARCYIAFFIQSILMRVCKRFPFDILNPFSSIGPLPNFIPSYQEFSFSSFALAISSFSGKSKTANQDHEDGTKELNIDINKYKKSQIS